MPNCRYTVQAPIADGIPAFFVGLELLLEDLWILQDTRHDWVVKVVMDGD